MKGVLCRLPIFLTFILATTTMVTFPAHADPADAQGVWREWTRDHVDRSGTRIPTEPTDSQLQEMFDRLSAVADLFRATPTLATPVGFDVKGSRHIEVGLPGWANGREPEAELGACAVLSLYLYPYTERRDGTDRASDVEWTGTIGVHANDPAPSVLMGLGMDNLDGERWYLEPAPIRTVGGYTMYEQVADDRIRRRGAQRFVVVTPPGFQPMWLPVTVEEYATDQIRRREAQLAQARERLAQFRLPRMSETHRRARESLERSTQQLMEFMPDQKEELQAQLDQTLRELDEAMGDADEADREAAEEERRMREAMEKQQAELGERIEAMKASLAAMSPAERRAQTVGKLHPHRPGASTEGEIVPPTVPGGSEARGVVRVNTDLFERRHQPTDLRFFFVNFYTNRDFMAQRFAALERQLNWNELARMIQ